VSAGSGARPLAEAASVSKRYGSFAAVDEVSMRVRPGEIVGLLGANGAGKTTLIKLLLGLAVPTSGTATLFGQAPDRATRRRLGYVPQGLGLWEALTVAQNLHFANAAFGAADSHLTPALEAVRDRPVSPSCWCSTSRPPGWTRSPGPGCGTPCTPRPTAALASSSPPTTCRRPSSATGWC
jgi:ABC-2 type transport system ATP-binding protein/ribosome-dependent ATPase